MKQLLRKLLFLVVRGTPLFALVLAACAPSLQPAAVPSIPPAQPAAAASPAPRPAPSPVTPLAGTPTPVPPAAQALPTPTLAPTQVKRGGTLRLVDALLEVSSDPHRYGGGIEMWEYLGNYIVNFDPQDGSPLPELAERWEFKDPRTLVLYIRKGIKFHNLSPTNGRELTAQDIVWNLERIRRPGPLYVWKSNFEPVESFTALDKYTVQIKLKAPFAPILSYLRGSTVPTQPIMAPEVEDKLGGEDAYKDLANARGTGPFMIKWYTKGVGALAVRNPDYWQTGKPYLDSVQMFDVQDLATQVAAFRTGKVDYAARASVLQVESKRDLERTNPATKFTPVSDTYVIVLVPNLSRKPFDDIRLRKAIFLALDREEELKVNVGGGGHISGPLSWKLFPGWTWSEQELLKREGYRPKNTPEGQQDIAEAQRLMRELGYSPEKPFVLEADATAGTPWVNLTALEVAKSQLQKVYINMSIKLLDRALYLDQDARGEFLFRSRGFSAPLEPDAQLYARHHSKGGRNTQKLNDSELDRLLDAQRSTLDISARKQLVRVAQERLWSLYPQMWLHVRDAYIVQQPWVEVQPVPSTWRRWGDPASTWINR